MGIRKIESGWQWLLRVWLLRTVAVAGLLAPGLVLGAQECGAADGDGIQRCRAGLDSTQMLRMHAAQEKSQWCWAASIAMIFSHHGFAVPQERIVRQHFSALIDRGVHASTITEMLGRSWRDGLGRTFSAKATVGDTATRRFLFRNDTVIRELIGKRPLLVGTLGHAMVLVQVEYERFTSQGAVRITGGTVIDPTPGQGVRQIMANEMHLGYVAAVQIDEESGIGTPMQNTAALVPTFIE